MYTHIVYPCVQVQSVTNILDCTWIVVQESSTICGSKNTNKSKTTFVQSSMLVSTLSAAAMSG